MNEQKYLITLSAGDKLRCIRWPVDGDKGMNYRFCGERVDRINAAIKFQEDYEKTIAEANAEIERLRSEIAYLAYFHREADFGPAHTDVVMAIQARYAEAFGAVPEYWRYE